MTIPTPKSIVMDIARTADFWIPGTSELKDLDMMHVLVRLEQKIHHDSSDTQVDGWTSFAGYVCRPALASIDHTPKNRYHVMTPQKMILRIKNEHVSVIQAAEGAIQRDAFVCLISCQMRVQHSKLVVSIEGNESGMAVWPDSSKGISKCAAELFAGGFGGWSFGLRHVSRRDDDPYRIVLAVDHDATVIDMFCRNHSGQPVWNNQEARGAISATDHPYTNVTVFNKTIQDPSWYHWISLMTIESFVCSPPCPSWSNGSSKQGYVKEEGQQTIMLAKNVRFTQPKSFLLENVKGFRTSNQFQLTVAIFRWAGFRLMEEFETDLHDVAPASRPRWVGLFVRNDIEACHFKLDWFAANRGSIRAYGLCELNMPDQMIQELILNKDEIEGYGNPKYFKGDSKSSEFHSDPALETCGKRVIDMSMVFKVFMASYGTQHHLPPHILEERGIYADLMVAKTGEIRFIAPAEQALCYAVDEIWIPRDRDLAFHCLGNAIAPQQAVYFARVMEICMGNTCNEPPMDLVMSMVAERLRPIEARFELTDDFWYMFQEGKIDATAPAGNHGHEDAFDTPPPKRSRVDTPGDAAETHEQGEDKPNTCPTTDPWSHGFPVDKPGETELDAASCSPTVRQEDMSSERMINVTFVFPFEVKQIRVAAGLTLKQMLRDEGMKPDDCIFTNLYNDEDVDDMVVHCDGVFNVDPRQDTDMTSLKAELAKEVDFLRFGDGEAMKKLTNVILCFRGNRVWTGMLPSATKLSSIDAAVLHTMKRLGVCCNVMWTHMGKALNPSWPWELQTISSAGTIKLWFHLPILGGGPSPTEEDLKNRVVAELATHGVPFVSLVTAVAQIFYTHKLHFIKKVMSIQDKEERWSAFQEMVHASGVHLPTKDRDAAARKIQKSFKRKAFPKAPEIDMSQIQIPSGTFVSADGAQVPSHNGPFTANGQGLVLTTLDEAGQWIAASKKLCCDEYAALLAGHHELDTSLKVSHIQCQGLQKNGTCILFKATLIQFGEKPISLAKIPQAHVDCPTTQVMSLTVYADDFQEQWKSMSQRPAKHILGLFSQNVREGAIRSVWGHSYRSDGKPCAPNQAQSIQIHVRVNGEHVHAMLRESGHNCALGIVRNKQMFGFRTVFDDFQAAWQVAFPNKEPPKQVKIQTLFKMQNLPVAFAQTELRQWLDSLQWNAKPIRRLGPGSWLVGAACDPPRSTCLCNEQLVLIQKVQSKVQERNTPVIVGQPMPRNTSMSESSRGQDPLQVDDAWAQFRERQGLNHKPDAAMAPAKPQAPREVDGPTTARLNDQDQKIDALRKKLDLLETNQESHHQKNAENFAKADAAFQLQAKQLASVEKNVEQKLQAHQKHTEDSLRAVTDAVQASAKANEDQFATIRQMLQEHSENLRRKAAKTTPRASPDASDKEM
eukprot:Skav219151  [mRNA]  locus=scaffold1574:827431:831790:+ [translate_table: standard]